MRDKNKIMDLNESSTYKLQFSRVQKYMLIACFIVTIIRLILRTSLVIVTTTPIGIPLIVSSLLSLAFLFHIKYKGGCSGTSLYFILELVLASLHWIFIVFVYKTNHTCNELGNAFCEDTSGQDLPGDYIRRLHPYWVLIILPGLIFDIFFVIVFRKPILRDLHIPRVELVEIDRSARELRRPSHLGGIGIGGIGNENKDTRIVH